jgi:hypothetical protein
VNTRRLLLLFATSACVAVTLGTNASGRPASGLPRCARRLPTSNVSMRLGAAEELVPGAPTAVVLCAYRGLNPAVTAGRLVRSTQVGSGPTLRWLVRTFDALRPNTGLTSCPMDDGTALVALFSYVSPPADPVTVGLSGCRIVQNGHVTRTASLKPGPALISRLQALIG